MKDIHLYYDNLDLDCKTGDQTGNGFLAINDVWNTNVHRCFLLPYPLKWNNINVHLLSINNLSNTFNANAINIYCIEPLCISSYIENNPIPLISPKALHEIQNGNIKLLIFFPLEGIHLFGSMDIISPMLSACRNKNIPLENIFVVVGDLNCALTYKNSFNNYFDNIIPLEYFQNDYQKQIYLRWFNNDQDDDCIIRKQKEYIDPLEKTMLWKTKRSHKFLSLNGNLRGHRIFIISEMKRRKIFHKGKVSCIGRYGDNPTLDHINPYYSYALIDDIKRHYIYESLKNYISDWKPEILDIDAEQLEEDDRQQDKNLYLQTYFSFVIETEIDKNILFITEKTFKPIVNLHPFLILGGKGILQYLREEGYHTFPQIFDESYDNEPDVRKRIKMVLDELERVVSLDDNQLHLLYQEVWPSLVHNQKLFLTKSHKEKYEKMFQSIC